MKDAENVGLNDTVNKIYDAVNKTLNTKCNKARIKNIVESQVSIVNKIWKEGTNKEKMKIAPGHEILQEVYAKFDLRYAKIKDGERISRRMKKSEIPTEIELIIKKLK